MKVLPLLPTASASLSGATGWPIAAQASPLARAAQPCGCGRRGRERARRPVLIGLCRSHIDDFITAYKFGRRLKPIQGYVPTIAYSVRNE